MTYTSAILKAVAVVLMIAALVQIVILVGIMDTEDQRLRAGELLISQTMSDSRIFSRVLCIGLTIVAAGLTFGFSALAQGPGRSETVEDDEYEIEIPKPPTSGSNVIRKPAQLEIIVKNTKGDV